MWFVPVVMLIAVITFGLFGDQSLHSLLAWWMPSDYCVSLRDGTCNTNFYYTGRGAELGVLFRKGEALHKKHRSLPLIKRAHLPRVTDRL